METLTIFHKRMITRFLNARDKIKYIALVSKEWNRIAYDGYSWVSLFDNSTDSTWIVENFNIKLVKKFHHFRGIQRIFISNKNYAISKFNQHI